MCLTFIALEIIKHSEWASLKLCENKILCFLPFFSHFLSLSPNILFEICFGWRTGVKTSGFIFTHAILLFYLLNK